MRLQIYKLKQDDLDAINEENDEEAKESHRKLYSMKSSPDQIKLE